MKKRKLKPFVVTMLYVFSIALLLGGVYVVENFVSNQTLKDKDPVPVVSDVVESVETVPEDVPVVATEPIIRRPYTDGNIKILKNYYDYQGEENVQEDSLVYYGNTYMQNSGVDYGMETEFEVVSILDGTVMEVNDDEVMGKTIKIKHNNDLISVYQSLGSVDVKVNDTVNQGMVLGKSGLSNVSRDLGNHLHFEIYYQGKVVNPENCYDKTVLELK
jgi:stage II sporulation protein Q